MGAQEDTANWRDELREHGSIDGGVKWEVDSEAKGDDDEYDDEFNEPPSVEDILRAIEAGEYMDQQDEAASGGAAGGGAAVAAQEGTGSQT